MIRTVLGATFVGQAAAACASSWQCPASWSTGNDKAPADAADAKAFIAAHNIYRCMHNVQAVQWDHEAYASAKSDEHDEKHLENRARTYPFSDHRGVDATHKWYAEIADCEFKESCYLSDEASHFSALVWSTVDKAAFSSRKPQSRIAKSDTVAHYGSCDGSVPNLGQDKKKHVPAPTKDYATCLAEVLSCNAFNHLKEEDIDGCDASAHVEGNVNMILTAHWSVVYGKQCKAKYADILDRLRLYNSDVPFFFRPGSVTVALTVLTATMFAVVSMAAFFLRRSSREPELRDRQLLRVECPQTEEEQGLCDIEASDFDESVA